MRFQNAAELRFLFASIVFLNHAIQLGQIDEYGWLQKIFSSEMAVYGFFILSGYLIVGSLERAHSLKNYYFRRILRIYPGYCLSVLFFLSVITLGRFNTGVPNSCEEIFKYLLANLTFLNFFHPKLNGVFSGNGFQEVNGALWSIKVELMFYMIAPFLVRFARRYSYSLTATLMILVGLSWPYFVENLFPKDNSIVKALTHQLPGQMVYFGIGVYLYQFAKQGYSNFWYIGLIIILSLIICLNQGLKSGFGMFCLLMLIVTFSKLPQIGDLAEKVDISYGIYLCHFPIIQILIANHLNTSGAFKYLTFATILTCAYGLVSWYLVERPAIRFFKRIKI